MAKKTVEEITAELSGSEDYQKEVQQAETKKQRRIRLIKERAAKRRKEEAKTSKKHKKTKKTKQPKSKHHMEKYRAKNLIDSMYAYFDAVWPQVDYSLAEELAHLIKPDTKFNKMHYSWYKNDYKNKRDLP